MRRAASGRGGGGRGRPGDAIASPPMASRSGRHRVAATESAGQAAPEQKNCPWGLREGHPCKFFFVLLRPPGVLYGVPSHPAISVATVLFCDLPARSGASSATGTALASTNTWAWRQRLARKKPAPCVDKTLLISFGHIAVTAAISIISTCVPEEEGGAKSHHSERRFVLSSSFIENGKKWNWNFTNCNFVTSD